MAASPPAPSSGPRYAPHDPTLPKPWKGLVDGNTGYLYFWNPDTNVTQYERPDAGTLPGPPPLPKNFLLSSSVQVRPLPTARSSYEDDDDDRKDLGGKKRDSRSSARNKHDSRGGAITSSGYKSSVMHNPESDAGQSSSKLSAESYRRKHEITVTGKDVPAPFMSFEATGFPAEILKEMRYLLQIGADVVRCGPPIGLLLFEVCT